MIHILLQQRHKTFFLPNYAEYVAVKTKPQESFDTDEYSVKPIRNSQFAIRNYPRHNAYGLIEAGDLNPYILLKNLVKGILADDCYQV